MLASLFLISLVGSAVAAPRPAVDVRAVDTSGWIVRADWSRCENATSTEVILDGVQGTTVGTGILEFEIPANGFSGTLVHKAAGAVGYGSPYPPPRITVDVLEEADADGNLGVATYLPASGGWTTSGSSSTTTTIAQVSWFTSKDQAISPVSRIGYNSLQGNVSVSAATQVSPSFLRVYYCSSPTI